MKITLDWLRENNACSEAAKAFEEKFGKEADYQAVLDEAVIIDRPDWASWLLRAAGRIESVLKIDGDLVSDKGIAFAGKIEVTGSIKAKFLLAGEGIKAGGAIKAGEAINAGGAINAGLGIEAGEAINAGGAINAGLGIEAGWWIKAGEAINAGGAIKAGGAINAGLGIEAGSDYGIYSGIRVRLSHKSQYAIITAKSEPKNIVCGEFKAIT